LGGLLIYLMQNYFLCLQCKKGGWLLIWHNMKWTSNVTLMTDLFFANLINLRYIPLKRKILSPKRFDFNFPYMKVSRYVVKRTICNWSHFDCMIKKKTWFLYIYIHIYIFFLFYQFSSNLLNLLILLVWMFE
jgi:hypothetical protein